MKTITQILTEWGADPLRGTDKNREHQYGAVYDSLFPPEKREKVRNVLEIGISYGNSLRSWREAFPNAVIWGADYLELTVAQSPGEERIVRLLWDQSDRYQVRPDLPDFSLIIDDASHRLKDQLLSMFLLWPHVAPGGFYVIEEFDVQNGKHETDLLSLISDRYLKVVTTVGKEGEEKLVILEKP